MADEKRNELAGQRLILMEGSAQGLGLAPAPAPEEAHVMHVYGPRVMIGPMPQEAAAVMMAAAPAVRVEDSALDEIPEDLSEAERLGLQAWNVRQSEEYARAKEERPRAELPWDTFEPPDVEETMHGEARGGESVMMLAPAPDMSAFLIGSVAVGLVIVEGPTADLQFSQEERTKVVAEVQEGLTWLAQQEPRANVTWSYDIRTIRVAVQTNLGLIGFEPRERLWRDPAMQQLGFSPDFQGVIDYVATIRQNLGTRWGYVGFFTKYPLHHFAYASKPRLVMHFANDGWGPDNIDRVFTHEAGHLFGCPDEYTASACNCQTPFGILQERNGNCRSCANPFIPCLMEANTWAMCDFTRTHLGWRDSNGDDRFDPEDL